MITQSQRLELAVLMEKALKAAHVEGKLNSGGAPAVLDAAYLSTLARRALAARLDELTTKE